MRKVHGFCLFTLLCLLMLGACGTAAPEPTPTPAVAISVPTENALRVILPCPPDVTTTIEYKTPDGGKAWSNIYPEWDETLEQFNQLLWDLGYDLTVEFYIGERFFDKNIDSAYYADYIEFVRHSIDENIVFILPDAAAYNVPEFIDGLRQSDLLYVFDNMGGLWRSESQRTRYNELEAVTCVPVNLEMNYPSVPAVLVRENEAVEYGKDINTASDYEDLLIWLKAKTPKVSVGVACLSQELPERYLPFDLFLPELGYFSAGNQDLFLCREDTNSIAPTRSIDAARTAIERLSEWRHEGLLTILNGGVSSNRQYYSQYPTVLLHAYDFMRLESPSAVNSMLNQFDARAYRMYTLYNGRLPVVLHGDEIQSSMLAIAGKQADATYFSNLLQVLSQRDGYMSFFYGEEEADYRLQDGRIELLDSESVIDRALVREVLLPYFGSAELTPVPLFAPGNYEESLKSFIFAREVQMAVKDSELVAQWQTGLNDNDLFAIFQMRSAYSSLLDNLYLTPSASDERSQKFLLDDYFNEQNNRLLNLYMVEVQQALDQATVQ